MNRNTLNLPQSVSSRTWFGILIASCFIGSIWGCNKIKPTTPQSEDRSAARQENLADVTELPVGYAGAVRSLVTSEELLLKLTTKLKALNASVVNLKLPDHNALSLFSDEVAVGPTATPVPRSSLSLLKPIIDAVDYIERAKFALISGSFADSSFATFDSIIRFEGLGKSPQGRWKMFQADIRCQWRIANNAKKDIWRVASWEVKRIESRDRQQLMFRDVLDDVLSANELRRARESRHWEIANRHYYPEFRAKAEGEDNRFFPISTANHPGIAVVDIDRDGFDDVYVTVRWGKNLLFRNRRNGTFEEVAADVGLDINGYSNAAVFADFDNDGDADVMMARSQARSLYLVNENGKFVDRTEQLISAPLPFEATSVSAADYNGDGLTDVYFSTYHQDDIRTRIDADLSHPEHRIHDYLSPEMSAELKRRYAAENRSFINQVGPPNILLRNLGNGQFELAAEQENVAVWRNSFQSTWSDFDDDGDQDLYVANDFAADRLLRNDGEKGFTEVGGTLGMQSLGFGMGVSFGDYDNDGQHDLYVSNMYSKAGMRITRQVDGLDPQIRQLSEGNYLYRNQGDTMQLVSGLADDALAVSRAGWSWGGQFVDVDNDSFLDLYVPNGYYTAPEQFESNVDL